MRFSIKNLIMWTLISSVALALGQLIGLPISILLTLVLVMVVLSYENGLQSAGLEANAIHEVVAPTNSALHDAVVRSGAENNLPSFERGQKLGPGIYIVAGLFLGLLPAAYLGAFTQSLAIFLIALFASPSIGGIIYRQRSQDWPIDPTVRIRYAKYAAFLLTLFPLICMLCVAQHDWKLSWIGLAVGFVVGLSLTFGALASGCRRDGKRTDSVGE